MGQKFFGPAYFRTQLTETNLIFFDNRVGFNFRWCPAQQILINTVHQLNGCCCLHFRGVENVAFFTERSILLNKFRRMEYRCNNSSRVRSP